MIHTVIQLRQEDGFTNEDFLGVTKTVEAIGFPELAKIEVSSESHVNPHTDLQEICVEYHLTIEIEEVGEITRVIMFFESGWKATFLARRRNQSPKWEEAGEPVIHNWYLQARLVQVEMEYWLTEVTSRLMNMIVVANIAWGQANQFHFGETS
jgi:hypothetical protein